MQQNILIFSFFVFNVVTCWASDKRPETIQTPKHGSFWNSVEGIGARALRKSYLEKLKQDPQTRDLAIRMALLTKTPANLDVLCYTNEEISVQNQSVHQDPMKTLPDNQNAQQEHQGALLNSPKPAPTERLPVRSLPICQDEYTSSK